MSSGSGRTISRLLKAMLSTRKRIPGRGSRGLVCVLLAHYRSGRTNTAYRACVTSLKSIKTEPLFRSSTNADDPRNTVRTKYSFVARRSVWRPALIVGLAVLSQAIFFTASNSVVPRLSLAKHCENSLQSSRLHLKYD